MESIQSIRQFCTVYPEAHAIICIVFYHYMFDFNNLLTTVSLNLPNLANTLLLRKKEKKLFLKNTEPGMHNYNQGLGPDAINPFTCKLNNINVVW